MHISKHSIDIDLNNVTVLSNESNSTNKYVNDRSITRLLIPVSGIVNSYDHVNETQLISDITKQLTELSKTNPKLFDYTNEDRNTIRVFAVTIHNSKLSVTVYNDSTTARELCKVHNTEHLMINVN